MAHTVSQHFSAIAQLIANLGDDAQLSQCNRECIPRSLLYFIDARSRINALQRSLPLATHAGDGAGKVKLNPLPPIDFVTQPKHAQKLASNIVKEVEVERYLQPVQSMSSRGLTIVVLSVLASS